VYQVAHQVARCDGEQLGRDLVDVEQLGRLLEDVEQFGHDRDQVLFVYAGVDR
jgi:hypothetical protein